MVSTIRRSAIAVFGLALFALCGAIALIESSDRWHPVKSDVPSGTTDIVKRVNMLSVLAELAGTRGFRTAVLIQGNYPAVHAGGKELQQWRQDAGVTSTLVRKKEQGKEAYRGSYISESIEGSILWFQEGDGRVYYTISIQSSVRNGMKQVATEGERIVKKLPTRYRAEWTATVQTVTDHLLKNGFMQAEKALQELGQVEPLDRYEDDHTISVSYQTNYMGSGVRMQQGYANLQLAAHENIDKGETQITFGTPLIAGEY